MAKGFVLRLGDQVGALCLNLENMGLCIEASGRRKEDW